MEEKAILSIGDEKIELPIITGSENEKAIDISKLRAQTGMTTYDPSYGNTASCSSAITYIDGEKGILRYRGIPIEQFQDNPDFIEVAWLLMFGSLPTRQELQDFRDRLTLHELVHEGLRYQFRDIPLDAPPMAILSATFSQLAYYHQEFLAVEDVEAIHEIAARLISKVRTIAAYAYRRSHGLPINYPDPSMRYCENLLHMMFSIPNQQYIVPQEISEALNLIFILHADHEQNCSTSTVRTVCSARANLFSSISAGVSALWGPLHGGANVEVVRMLERIHKGGLSAEDCVRMAKDKESEFRLFGFGHRVYKNYDPRARILHDACDKVFKVLNVHDPLLDIARRLEELALEDSYFVDRNLYPNVDFYSGIILRAMGIPTDMFTVCFAIGRLPGWIAQWREQHEDPSARITRPRQVYTGPTKHDYVPIDQR